MDGCSPLLEPRDVNEFATNAEFDSMAPRWASQPAVILCRSQLSLANESSIH